MVNTSGSNIATTLSDAQLRQYRQEGWCIVGKILDDRVLEALRAEEKRFREYEKYGPHETIFRSQLAPYSQVIRDFITRGPAVEIGRQLVGPNLAVWFNQFVTKMPDGNSGKSEFPWHQDNGYAAVYPPTNVTIWIPLDNVDTHNGCVWVMPHSHEQGLLDHNRKSEDSWHLSVKVEGDGVPAILKAGEAVAFTGLTLHRSKLNHSDKPRRAFFIEYADAAAEYARPGDAKRTPVTHNPNTWVVAGELAWGANRAI